MVVKYKSLGTLIITARSKIYVRKKAITMYSIQRI